MNDLQTLRTWPVTRDGRKLLVRWYGQSRVTDQTRRWQKLVNTFEETFGNQMATIVSSPGRTELGGNHTDHNDGRVLCAAVHLDTLACVAIRDDASVDIRSDGWPTPIVVSLDKLEPVPAEKGTPEALVRGVAAAMVQRGGSVGGFSAVLTGDVPAGSGLSSSASVEVLLAQIQNILYNNGKFSQADLAMIGQQAENVHFGKPCGLMDQMACALGGIETIDFGRPGKPRWARVTFNFEQAGYVLAIVNAGGSHADLTDDYAAIPGEMHTVADLFGMPSLRKLGTDKLVRKAAAIREKAGDRALLRAFHFVAENERVPEMVRSLESGRIRRYLKLVRKSGDSSWKLLQNVVRPGADREQPLAAAITLATAFLGGTGAVRVHGGGFAGTIQAYVHTDHAAEFADFMDARFGKGATKILHIRPDGVMEARA